MERIFMVYGTTGVGKTTAVKALLRDREHVFVIDPMGDYGGPDWSICETRRGVEQAVMDRIRKGRPLKIAYRCGGAVEKEAPWLASSVKRMQLDVKKRVGLARTPKITLVMDEANMYYRALGVQPAHCRIFDELVSQGRHYAIDIIGVTQFPSQVSRTPRGVADVIYAFYMPMDRDRKAVDEKTEGASAVIKTLPKFYCVRARLMSLEMMKTAKNGSLKLVKKL